jgi:Tol biopolymer transport system component
MTSCLLLATACGARLSGNPVEGQLADAAPAADAAADDAAPPPDAAPLGPWSTPARVGPAALTTRIEDDVTLSSDARELIFAVANPTGSKDLYYTSRAVIGGAWTTPAVLLPFDTIAASEETPRFSGDDKTLYFASDRVTPGNLDIYAVTRPAAGSTQWGLPRVVTGLATGVIEKWFAPCGTDRYVVVRSTTAAGTDLFEGTLGGGAPAAIPSLNSPDNETGSFLTQDCLTIYFASTRVTPQKIFVSHRATATAAWPQPMPVDDFKITGGNGNQEDPWLSSDGRTFAFASDAAGDKDIYLSTR